MRTTQRGKRGRPTKFGRTAEAITLRLPQDVIDSLSAIDKDIAWAIVKLLERSKQVAKKRQVEVAMLYQVPGGRALILVRPDHFNDLPGVSLIQLADGRAFLALKPASGVAELEIAVVSRLEDRALAAPKRAALERLRELLQGWRREGIDFETRTIIIAKRASARPKLLASLRGSK